MTGLGDVAGILEEFRGKIAEVQGFWKVGSISEAAELSTKFQKS